VYYISPATSWLAPAVRLAFSRDAVRDAVKEAVQEVVKEVTVQKDADENATDGK